MTLSPEVSFLDHALATLRSMVLAREGDLRESVLARQGRGSFQISGAGHEAVAALAPHVRDEDMVFPAYRDRALMHALGMTAEETARDFLAREGSSSGGRNLPGHFSSRRLNVFSVTSPVGAQCLPAVGAAWARRMEGRGAVVLCHIGDAATRQGEFFEAVAQAVQDRLPVVFVVEDNGYGISTPTRGTTPLALGMLPEAILDRVDGRDAGTVFERGGAAVARARAGEGPTVLWLDLDRLGSHTNADDHRTYRSLTEIDAMQAGDPLGLLAESLIASGGLDDAGWAAMRQATATAVREAYARVEREPAPGAQNVEDHLYGPQRASYPLSGGGTATTMLQAVNGTLRAGLAAEARTIVFGEDVEDPKGGVFGLTKGLSAAFPGRVVNSPLAEATVVGTAVGLAAAGWRPVFELQFVDFVGPAFNQLIAQAANLRWRTMGEWTCPLTLVAPCGAYLPGGGMWHSQSNEGWFAGTPGLRVAVPSTPEDAAGLLWASMHDDDPSLLLLPKHLLRAERPVYGTGDGVAIPWGKGRVVRGGRDATVVAWGNCVEVAEAAADLLAEDGTQVEVVDLRTLVPCDWDLVAASVARTGRLVVVQEDSRTCGFGQAVLAEMAIRPELFDALRSAPRLVSRPDVPVPFNADLERAVLPSASSVAEAVRATLAHRSAALPATRSEEKSVEDGWATLTIPQLGEGLRRVRVTAHLKRPGERVAADEPLYEVETDKANVVVESPVEGVLREWCVAEGEEADVYGPIARLATDAAYEPAPVPEAARRTTRSSPSPTASAP